MQSCFAGDAAPATDTDTLGALGGPATDDPATAAAAEDPADAAATEEEEADDESPPDFRDVAADMAADLCVEQPSESLTEDQIDRAIDLAAEAYGVPAEFLDHIAASESSNDQTADNGAAHGLMQIERVHTDAYLGEVNVGNDTLSNIAYAALEASEISDRIDRAFVDQDLEPPTGLTKSVLMDLAYNRGPGIVDPIARRAAEQGIDPEALAEYFAGPGGTATFHTDPDRGNGYYVDIEPGTDVEVTGQGSVLQEVVEHDVRHLTQGRRYQDRSQDGVRDHFDIFINRTGSMLDELGRLQAGDR